MQTKLRKLKPLTRAACVALLLGLSPLAFSPRALAQQANTTKVDVPHTLSYQGYISDANGPIKDGSHSITITFYSDKNGTTSMWSATYTASIKNGVFNLLLGADGTPALPPSTEMNRPIWAGISVDGAKEEGPLTSLSASPYALNVPDNSVTTSKLADQAVTSAKIGADYVGSISVNGQKVSGRGGDVNIVAGDGLAVTVDPITNNVVLDATVTSKMAKDKGAHSEWIGFNPGTNVDGSANAPNPDLTNVIGGGGGNTANPLAGPPGTSTGGYASILGGLNNTAGYATGANNGNKYASVGGGQFNTANATGGTVGGGEHNTAGTAAFGASSDATVSGGDHNNATGVESVIGGGGANAASGNQSVVSGGLNNNASAQYATISGGHSNASSATGATTAGGESNTASGADAVVSGGDNNTASGTESAIAGGAYLKVGANSFGFNNQSTTGATSDVSGFASPSAYFGNVNLHIGNTDNAARSLVMWGPNSSLNYTGTAKSTTITAGSPSASVTYTLPSAAPAVSGYVLSSTVGGAMSWIPSGTATTVPWSGVTTSTNNGQTLNVGTGSILQPVAVPGPGFGTIVANAYSGTLPEVNGGTGHGANFTAGSVIYESGGPGLTEDNANFFYDGTNHRLGLGTTTPSEALDVKGANALIEENGGNGGLLKIKNNTSGFTSTFKESATATANADYILPTAGPTAVNQVLTATTAVSPYQLAWLPGGGGGGNAWHQTGGNAGTIPGTGAGQSYLGTSDAKDLVVATNATEHMRIANATGNVGINQPAPAANEKLDVNGTIWSENVLGNGPAIGQMGEIHKDNQDLAWGLIPGIVPFGGPVPIPVPGAATTFNVIGPVTWYPPNICVVTVSLPPGGSFAASPVSPWNPVPVGEACVTANVIQDANFTICAPGPGGAGVAVGDVPGFATVTSGGQAAGLVPLTACPPGIVPPLAPNQFAVLTYKMSIPPGAYCGGGAVPTLVPVPLPFSFRVVGR